MEIDSSIKAIPDIGTFHVYDLFHNTNVSLSIPEYQRPYIWSEEHIVELLNDWHDHFFNKKQFNENAIEYYMGTVMINSKKGKYEIIDGQQRLTTLIIMDFVWSNEQTILKKGKLNFTYNSISSLEKIKENRNYLKGFKGGEIAKFFNQILKKLVFSIVITSSEDQAFVFFESQNNRGVPLDEVDFFKSFHLRELNTNEQYLKYFAKKFDNLNSLNNAHLTKGKHLSTLNELFIKQFWRIRFWSKSKLWFPTRRSLLETFQKNTLSFETLDDIKLYPSKNNSLGSSLIFNEDMKPEMKTTIKLYGSESIDIPFTINQPIQRGIGFFLYTEKYTSLYNYIFRDGKVVPLNEITDLVYNLYNNYFINLYQTALVLYYDKFGTENIAEFAKWVEHYLGSFRMNRSSIVEQSPIVLLRDYGNILMDIQQSYLPIEVFESLRRYVPENYYTNFNYEVENIGSLSIVILTKTDKRLTTARQNYYQQVKSFYKDFITKNNYQLTEKHNWINASFHKHH